MSIPALIALALAGAGLIHTAAPQSKLILKLQTALAFQINKKKSFTNGTGPTSTQQSPSNRSGNSASTSITFSQSQEQLRNFLANSRNTNKHQKIDQDQDQHQHQANWNQYQQINQYQAKLPLKILFVSRHNTCLSQMAEVIANSMGHEAMSAGCCNVHTFYNRTSGIPTASTSSPCSSSNSSADETQQQGEQQGSSSSGSVSQSDSSGSGSSSDENQTSCSQTSSFKHRLDHKIIEGLYDVLIQKHMNMKCQNFDEWSGQESSDQMEQDESEQQQTQEVQSATHDAQQTCRQQLEQALYPKAICDHEVQQFISQSQNLLIVSVGMSHTAATMARRLTKVPASSDSKSNNLLNVDYNISDVEEILITIGGWGRVSSSCRGLAGQTREHFLADQRQALLSAYDGLWERIRQMEELEIGKIRDRYKRRELVGFGIGQQGQQGQMQLQSSQVQEQQEMEVEGEVQGQPEVGEDFQMLTLKKQIDDVYQSDDGHIMVNLVKDRYWATKSWSSNGMKYNKRTKKCFDSSHHIRSTGA